MDKLERKRREQRDDLDSYGDDRALAFCAMCGGETSTRDHLPAKILLDEPLPDMPHIVLACHRCNNGRSADEEYLACAVEIAIRGSADPMQMERVKVRKALQHSPGLAAHFTQLVTSDKGATSLVINDARVSAVFVKLAKGHALYDLHETHYGPPTNVRYSPFHLLSDAARAEFENPPMAMLWPEVGGRAFRRVAETTYRQPKWVIVQAGRYRYLAAAGHRLSIRIVLSEFLGAEVLWDDS